MHPKFTAWNIIAKILVMTKLTTNPSYNFECYIYLKVEIGISIIFRTTDARISLLPKWMRKK